MSSRIPCTIALLALLTSAVGCTNPPVVALDNYVAYVPVRFSSEDAVEKTLSTIPYREKDRAERIAALFRAAGCRDEHLELQPIIYSEHPNVICTLPGESEETIVVGAHYDKRGYGAGVVDNWSGVSVLPHLYRSLTTRQRRHTYVFVAFSKAALGRAGSSSITIGHTGSRYYLRMLGEEGRAKIKAMVNLKGIGLASPSVWESRSDMNMILDLASVGESVGVDLNLVNFRRHEDKNVFTVKRGFPLTADSASFRIYAIPTITIHSFRAETAKLLHQPRRDRSIDPIDLDDYYATYRMVAVYLGYLDQSILQRVAAASTPEP